MNTKKLMITTAITLIALSAHATASPAQDLFNQAVYYIAFYYNGYSSADYENFSAQYQPELDSICKDVPEECSFETAVPLIQKMIGALSDGHTYLLSKSELQQTEPGSNSPVPRLGVISQAIENSSDRLIVEVYDASPAAKAGIQRGDRIVSLNNQPSSAYPEGLQAAILKANATRKIIRLGLQRATKLLEVTLKAEAITPPAPSMRVLPNGIGLIRIPTFEMLRGVAPVVHDLVRRARQQKLRGIIVDVRNNPGGIDLEFIASAGAFVKTASYTLQTRQSTTIRIWTDKAVSLSDSTGVPITELYPLENAALWTGKMAVLVNGASYSGAEYFAQAIQDQKRGLIIGEVTGGLGNTVTTQYSLRDGSAMALTLGRSLRKDGLALPERVKPDILISDDLNVLAASGRDLVLERALELIGTK